MRNQEIGFIENEDSKKDEELKSPKKIISRRDFLKLGAVSLATAILTPEKLLSQDKDNQEQMDLKENKENDYGNLGSLLRWNVEIEKPNEYQLKQIVEMKDKIISKVKNKDFASMIEMLKFMNLEIDANFDDKKSTVYLKDVFAEKEGVSPKGNFDCDSRAVMCQTVLEELDFTNNNVEMCAFEGHMMLRDKEKDQYFETTKNKVADLSESEKVQLNIINSYDKYLSYLISNEATQLGLEGGRGALDSQREDKNKLSQAMNKFDEALKLDKGNITAGLNFIKLITDKLLTAKGEEKQQLAEQGIKTYQNILMGLVKRYYNITNKEVSNDLKLKSKEEVPNLLRKKEIESLNDLGRPVDELIKEAIVNNDYIEKKFYDYANFNYSEINNFEEAIKTWQVLLGANENFNDKELDKMTCKIYIAYAYFKNKNYEQFIKSAKEALNSSDDILSDNSEDSGIESVLIRDRDSLNSQILVAKIITGEIKIREDNVEDFCNKYKNDNFLKPFINDEKRWNMVYIEAKEALENWSGFDKMMQLIKKTKISQEAVEKTEKMKKNF